LGLCNDPGSRTQSTGRVLKTLSESFDRAQDERRGVELIYRSC
jgi:hypothetical protein